MSVVGLIQWILSILIVIFALYVVFAKNIVRAAFALFFVLFLIAGIYLTLGADLISAFQVLIYVGGILILILFGVMLTEKYFNVKVFGEPVRVVTGILISLFVFIILAIAGYEVFSIVSIVPQNYVEIEKIGVTLLTFYLFPFEFASLTLLLVIIGAGVLSRREVR